MNYNYNKLRYVELLVKKKIFESKDLLFKGPDYTELAHYETILIDQCQYNKKKDYRSIIQNYQTGKINVSIFRLKFFKLYKENNEKAYLLEENLNKLFSFNIDPKSYGFSDLLTEIFEHCDAVSFIPDPTNSYEMTEEQFRKSLDEIFLRMKKYFHT